MIERFTCKIGGYTNELCFEYEDDHEYYIIKQNGTYSIGGEAIDKFAHYEDLEEQGRLIELPCKIGEKVYEVNKTCEERNLYCEDRYCNKCKTGSFIYRVTESCFKLSQINDVNKTVFLTKEEAEAKLKELRGE